MFVCSFLHSQAMMLGERDYRLLNVSLERCIPSGGGVDLMQHTNVSPTFLYSSGPSNPDKTHASVSAARAHS